MFSGEEHTADSALKGMQFRQAAKFGNGPYKLHRFSTAWAEWLVEVGARYLHAYLLARKRVKGFDLDHSLPRDYPEPPPPGPRTDRLCLGNGDSAGPPIDWCGPGLGVVRGMGQDRGRGTVRKQRTGCPCATHLDEGLNTG